MMLSTSIEGVFQNGGKPFISEPKELLLDY